MRDEAVTATNVPAACTGPLVGTRVLDLSALGPGPFCSMLLADAGADVVSVERPENGAFDPAKHFARGKRSAVVDLRAPRGAEVIARLAEHADVLIESNRPQTLERWGLGPQSLCERNPRLIYARLTGWGQDGPYSRRAGHDINYLSVSGVLGVLAQPDGSIAPPLGLLGDIAGGALFCALGIAMALFERASTGRGQVIDAAIVDGAALLNLPYLGEFNDGVWPGAGLHILSGAAPFYGVYRCADGGRFAVGAIEPKFHAALLRALSLDEMIDDDHFNNEHWEVRRRQVAQAFSRHPRAHWESVFAEIDGCGTPVLELEELPHNEHLRARGSVADVDGRYIAAAAPRFSEHRWWPRPHALLRGIDTADVLLESGFSESEIEELAACQTIDLGS
jgi:alpha-methylacyl-CoA racemase